MTLESSPEKPVPLREMASAVKNYVERCGRLWVSAQIIELTRRKGFNFLTLRDTSEEVSVSVSLSSTVLDAAGPVSEGMAVTAELKPTVWLKSGRLSYECSDLRPTGEGQLLAQIEHLKRLLQAEGLFDPALKKTLPGLPRGIGLITGKDSAAERDVVVNVRGRWPAARIVTRHSLVQGPGAASGVMAALKDLDADPSVDVIVIARGGGSVEDLLPFSDEGLVRAVAAARTPIVSAIGHEVDTPILDLVADLRASTPTDAAKRIVPDAHEELAGINGLRAYMVTMMSTFIDGHMAALTSWRERPVLRDPLSRFQVYAQQIETLRGTLHHVTSAFLDREHAKVSSAKALVGSLGPQSALTRGYSILLDDQGNNISSVSATTVGAHLTAHVSDGRLSVNVTDITKENNDHN
jgi:exodeoxyribonuclease VII large subunit